MKNPGRLLLLPGLDGTGLLFGPLLGELGSAIEATVIPYPDAPLDVPRLASEVLTMRTRPPVSTGESPAGTLETGSLLDDSILLAESFSSLVLLHLLIERGARPAGVIFVSGFAASPRPWLLALVRHLPLGALALMAPSALHRHLCVGHTAPAMLIETMRSALSRVSAATLTRRLAILASSTAPQAPVPDLPCLILRATGDRLVPARATRSLAELFPHPTVVDVSGPHFLLQARPVECADRILRFAGSL